jgi:hypothetical protein
MVHAIQKWNKIVDYLQAKTKPILPRNSMMCKDKWNSIHGDYKKNLLPQRDMAQYLLLGFNSRGM